MTISNSTSGSVLTTMYHDKQKYLAEPEQSQAQPTPQPVRAKRDDPPKPAVSSDDYANYVLTLGQQKPLTSEQLSTARWDAVTSVAASHSSLIDPHTADMIGNTVLSAVNNSPTFRSVLSYGLNHGQNQASEQLRNATYTNAYKSNWHFRGEYQLITNMTEQYLSQFPVNNMPIEVDPYSQQRDEEKPPIINVPAAPNADSPYLPAWQHMLLHELVHHLADAADPPPSESQSRLGPTEILAQRVSQEVGLNIPSFHAYNQPERSEYLENAMRAGLMDAVHRNADHSRSFFARLDRISAEQHASPDFAELEAAPPGAVASDHSYTGSQQPPEDHVPHNHTYAADQQPQGDLDRMEFRYSEPLLFNFAHSAETGAPTGYSNASAASSAPWETQGRFFRYGKPVDGNPHVREFGFPDGSKLIASAHEPQLASSDMAHFQKGAMVVGGALSAGLAAAAFGGPVGFVAGAAAGAGIGGAAASTVPYDRIWQAYTLDYYDKGSTTPSTTQYMYAWDSDPSRVASLNKQKDASLWPDYADGASSSTWNWWRWHSGSSPMRT